MFLVLYLFWSQWLICLLNCLYSHGRLKNLNYICTSNSNFNTTSPVQHRKTMPLISIHPCPNRCSKLRHAVTRAVSKPATMWSTNMEHKITLCQYLSRWIFLESILHLHHFHPLPQWRHRSTCLIRTKYRSRHLTNISNVHPLTVVHRMMLLLRIQVVNL